MSTNAEHLRMIEAKLEVLEDDYYSTRTRYGDGVLVEEAFHHPSLLHRIAAFREIAARCREGIFMDNATHRTANIGWFISDGNQVVRLYAHRKFKIRNPHSKKQYRRVRNYCLIHDAAYEAVEEAESLRDYLLYGDE